MFEITCENKIPGGEDVVFDAEEIETKNSELIASTTEYTPLQKVPGGWVDAQIITTHTYRVPIRLVKKIEKC
jgi:hypothetical protein